MANKDLQKGRPSTSKTASVGIYLQAEGVNMVEYQGLMVMGKSCADLCQAF